MKKKEHFLKKNFFWDVDFEKLDLWKNRNYIIGRVLEWGDVDEVIDLFKYYDKEVIAEAVVKNPEISKKTVTYMAFVLNIDRKKFTSWKKKQSTLTPFEH